MAVCNIESWERRPGGKARLVHHTITSILFSLLACIKCIYLHSEVTRPFLKGVEPSKSLRTHYTRPWNHLHPFKNYRSVPRMHPLSRISPSPIFCQSSCAGTFVSMWTLNPLKAIAVCHIKAYFAIILHQTASKSTEIAHSCGNCRSVMVITRNYNDPTHKPPPLFCLMLACRKGDVFAGFICY